jgi:aspartate/methionine/tyrosine aminotransferase
VTLARQGRRSRGERRRDARGRAARRESERGTFYVWASIADLAPPFGDAEVFFRRARERKVMTVPGRFFDVDPRKQRAGESPYRSWVRFSFGPPEANVRTGLERLEALLSE